MKSAATKPQRHEGEMNPDHGFNGRSGVRVSSWVRVVEGLKDRFLRGGRPTRVFFLILLASTVTARAEPAPILVDRVVASIDDRPVFLSELREFSPASDGADDEQDAVGRLQQLIDRKILLLEARRLRLDRLGHENLNEAELIERYMEFAVRTFVGGGAPPRAEEARGRAPGIRRFTLGAPDQREQAYRERFRRKMEGLRARYDIRVQLGETGAVRLEVDPTDSPK